MKLLNIFRKEIWVETDREPRTVDVIAYGRTLKKIAAELVTEKSNKGNVRYSMHESCGPFYGKPYPVDINKYYQDVEGTVKT